MKTSSLSNTKQKAENVELETIRKENQNVMGNKEYYDSKGVRMKAELTDVDETNTTGVDNLGYGDSLSKKKANVLCRKGENIPETFTTVVVHNESDYNEDSPYILDNSTHINETSEHTKNIFPHSVTDKKYTDVSLNVNKTLKVHMVTVTIR